MDNESKFSNLLLVVAIIGLVIFWVEYSNLQTKLAETEDILADVESEFYDTKSDLSDCGDALTEANMQIEDAQSYAWNSYDEMGETLENLYPVDY